MLKLVENSIKMFSEKIKIVDTNNKYHLYSQKWPSNDQNKMNFVC